MCRRGRPGTAEGVPGHSQECQTGPVAAGTVESAAEGPAAHVGAATRGCGRPPCGESPLSWGQAWAPQEGHRTALLQTLLRMSVGE